jgi:hypothetical protein
MGKIAALDNSLLFVLLILISFGPSFLALFGIRSLAIGPTCFAINLAICAAGYLTGRYRAFWVLWAISSLIVLVLIGMINPLSAIIVLLMH